MKLLTICVLTLKNGFTVIGQSACASPENYDESIGQNLAYQDARNKVWALMGYALRDKLMAEQNLLGSRAFPEDEGQGVYIGTKVVHASPMNRQDYNTLKGWQLPVDENGSDEGYLVENTDPLHARGPGGYVTWMPKDVFEGTFRQVGG